MHMPNTLMLSSYSASFCRSALSPSSLSLLSTGRASANSSLGQSLNLLRHQAGKPDFIVVGILEEEAAAAEVVEVVE
ncbi:hypothetical protein WG66_004570, partial [Moniliophthora roreri]